MIEQVAATILSGFLSYHRDFEQVTWLAQRRFEERDWEAGHRDIAQRLGLYESRIDDLVTRLREMLGDRLTSRDLWKDIKPAFAHVTHGHVDAEIAESFYNSLVRELFMHPLGVDRELLFVVATQVATEHFPHVSRRYDGSSTPEIIHNILADFPFLVGYRDIVGDSHVVAERLGQQASVEVVRSIFYRNKGAYIVGRLGDGRPFALALVHPEGPDGAVVDAVMTDENEISILFSFARQSFRVASPCPYALVAYLKALMPRKPVSELYTAVGYNKHGKTELYRNFIRHLEADGDLFIKARGERGMVMACFTLPSYDVVFKVIKDQFGYPKRTTRTKVINCYLLVARHDRLGRMVDAQQFEHLRLPLARFSKELLDELLEVAPSTVVIDGTNVLIHHAYTERRVSPLNLFIHEAPEPEARKAILDYGLCIKELCASNIFPGDMFLKNFGVTRHGRVVFYDYDEISLVTECNFRTMPHTHGEDDDLEGEAYFYVGPHDVFPEEFPRFVGIPDHLLGDFMELHGDLFTVAFWEERKRRLKAGDWTDVFPYPQERRLPLRTPA